MSQTSLKEFRTMDWRSHDYRGRPPSCFCETVQQNHLLLSPTNPTSLSDTDYHARNIEAGFAIEAIVSLPPESGINQQTKASWPWDWNGSEAVVPSIDGEMKGEPVYRLRVRGTEDLELAYEIVQPDGTADTLPVGLRRSIGLVRLSGDDRNDRDLRLVQGS